MGSGPCVSEFPCGGTLYLTASPPETQSLLCRVAENAGLQCENTFEDVVGLPVSWRQLHRLARDWSDALSLVELARTKCYLADSHDAPSYADLMNSQPLGKLIDWVHGQWLNDVIDSDRLVTHFQPIVHTADPGVVYGHECLLRGHGDGGELISPFRLYAAARGAGSVDHLDCAARGKAIESASSHALSTSIFINFNPRSIDKSFRSIKETLRAAMASPIATDNYVFEVVESDEVSDTNSLLEIVHYLREAGCRIALDDVGAGYNSLNLVSQLKPDIIKIDMGLIHGVDGDVYKARVTAKLLELAHDLGVKTVVEGVETEGEWLWTLQHGADFAQGFLFARPAAVPPESAFLSQPIASQNGRAAASPPAAQATCE